MLDEGQIVEIKGKDRREIAKLKRKQDWSGLRAFGQQGSKTKARYLPLIWLLLSKDWGNKRKPSCP